MFNAYTPHQKMKKEDVKGWLYAALYFAVFAAVVLFFNR